MSVYALYEYQCGHSLPLLMPLNVLDPVCVSLCMFDSMHKSKFPYSYDDERIRYHAAHGRELVLYDQAFHSHRIVYFPGASCGESCSPTWAADWLVSRLAASAWRSRSRHVSVISVASLRCYCG